MSENERLLEALRKIRKDTCDNCGRTLDMGDVAWNTGSTEYGTEYSVMEIICQACDNEVLHQETWSSIDNLNDFIDELKEMGGEDA